MSTTLSSTGAGPPPVYLAIDLKSYYASVECRQRKENPLTFNLLVADENRSNKAICLAISPSLKAIGVGSRTRLFEAKQAIALSRVSRIKITILT